ELESRFKYPAPVFDERRKEALKACKFHEDAQPLLLQPGPYRAQIDSLIQRVSYHMDHQPPTQTTPYRKAFVHIKTALEKAQKGAPAAPHGPDDRMPTPARTASIGDRVPDFAVSSLTDDKTAQWQSYKGKPALVFFYNPATPLGSEVITYAKQLSQKHG